MPLSSDVSARDIVQLDIVRTRERHQRELFRLWPGSASNRVEVCTADGNRKQLVLLVHEPPRRFVTRVSKHDNIRGARVIARADSGRRGDSARPTRSATSSAAATSRTC